MVFAAKCVNERREYGGGRVVCQGLDPLSAPQAHPDEKDGAANQSHVRMIFGRLWEQTENQTYWNELLTTELENSLRLRSKTTESTSIVKK